MPTVSVCVPTYNYAHYIGECIRTVLNQTHEDWELIVVDNHSSDNTAEVVRSFCDPRIRFIENDRNIGMVPNWNRCASLATGEYIGILPADDAYLPQMLERSVNLLDGHPPVAFTYSSVHRFDEKSRVVETVHYYRTDQVMDSETALRSLLMGCYVSPPSVLMRRSAFVEAGGFDETYAYGVDWEMWLRMASSHGVAYIAEPLAYSRFQHAGSITAREVLRRPRLVTAEEVRILEDTYKRLPKTVDWEKIRRQATKNLIDRHVEKTLKLLRQGRADLFRSELAYASSLHPAFPLKYRKMTALWIASLFGSNLANRLDSSEQRFWRRLQGGSTTESTSFSPVGQRDG